jgi:proline iminopeptidase
MFPSIDPFEMGMLEVGDAQQIYWECSGNPDGLPVVYLHGGPGSGNSPGRRRYFDPAIYKIILTDQRGCGRSQPHVTTVQDLEINTTAHLVRDLDCLREHLRIDRWTLLGGSWGATLALAYAQTHPSRVNAIVLASVTTTSHREVKWITHDIGRIFPRQWEKFAAVAANDPSQNASLVDSYARLVFSDDVAIRESAARGWCAWEDTHVSLSPGYTPNRRFEDSAFRLLFTRLVTHYWKHAAFLSEEQLIRNVSLLNDIPGMLLHGRYDLSSPLETAWRLHKGWRGSELRIVDDAGHGDGSMPQSIVAAMSLIGFQR